MSSAEYYTVRRRVTFDVVLAGDSVIYQQAEDARRILVTMVRLHFDHDRDGSSVSAYLHGRYLLSTGEPGKIQAADSAGRVFELWPEWLQALANEHRPERYAQHRGSLVPA